MKKLRSENEILNDMVKSLKIQLNRRNKKVTISAKEDTLPTKETLEH